MNKLRVAAGTERVRCNQNMMKTPEKARIYKYSFNIQRLRVH